MKIARVTATPLHVPLEISLAGIERKVSLEACFVEVETDTGLSGHGLAAITRETVIAEIVNGVIAPAIRAMIRWPMSASGTNFIGHCCRAARPGESAWAAGLAAARRRPRARAALCYLRLQLLRSRAVGGRRQAMGSARLPAAENGRRP